MKLKNLCLVASISAALCLMQNASATNWDGNALDGRWANPANWTAGVPTNTAGMGTTIDPATNASSYPTIIEGEVESCGTLSDHTSTWGTIYGPEWGQHLNIYGTLYFDWCLGPVQWDATPANRTIINLYTNSYLEGVNCCIGNNWWWQGGPYVTMNMFGSALAVVTNLWLGGHVNIYDNATLVINGGSIIDQVIGSVSAATKSIDLAGGTLKLPTGSSSTVSNLIAQGRLLAYGKSKDTNDLVVTDDGTYTIVTCVPLGNPAVPTRVYIQPLPTNFVVGGYQQANVVGDFSGVTGAVLSTAEPGVSPRLVPGAASFASSDPKVFTVSSTGVLAGLKAGSAILTATMGTNTNSVTVTITAQAAATLVHRYSFNEEDPSSTTTADSIGGATATLSGMAALSGSGELALPGYAGSYVALPPGVVSNMDTVTIETWATFPGTNAAFAYLFAFGGADANAGNGGNYIMLSPHSTTNTLANTQANFGVDFPGSLNEDDAVMTGSLDNTTNVQIVAVFNPLAGYVTLYTNGVSVATYSNQATFLALQAIKPNPLVDTLGADLDNYIGQSLYAADPALLANIDEFRIYKGALTPGQIAADYALGPNQLPGTSTSVSLSAALSGSNLILKWPTTSALVTLMSSPALGSGAVWTQVTGIPTIDGANYRTIVPASSGAKFFRLQR